MPFWWGGQAARDLDVRSRALCVSGWTTFYSLAQRPPFEQLQPLTAGTLHADVVPREDVRVIQRRSGARFLLEALEPAGMGRGIGAGRTLIATSRPSRGSRPR